MTRRGFTLVEMMVAFVLSGMVLISIHQLLLASQRSSQLLVQRIDVQQYVRSAVNYLSGSLRELNATDGDIVSLSPTSMRFRSMQWSGVLCADPVLVGTDLEMPIRTAPLFGMRGPDAALDSVLVFRDGDIDTRMDDRWLSGGITGVDTGICADGSTANMLTVRISTASGGADSALVGVTSGAPMRGFQIEYLSLYTMIGGRVWLGQSFANRSTSWTGVQPLIGPLATAGVTFTFFDAAGVPTADRLQVASVGIVVRSESTTLAHVAGDVDYVRDSLSTHIALRNNRRY